MRGFKFSLLYFFSKKTLPFIVSLLFIITLLFVPFISEVNEWIGWDVEVKNEAELREAISVALDNTEYVIGLSKDITLEKSLDIPVGKSIVLVGVGDVVWRLVGANNQNTISVFGLLTIDGICVTHVEGDSGRGVYVGNGGTFTMLGGVISGNNIDDAGGGVCINESVFVMLGGEITGNTATTGGGMYSTNSSIERRGGTIWGNNATRATSSYNDVAQVEVGKRPSDLHRSDEVDESPYFLFGIVAVIVVVVIVLLFYRSKMRKRSIVKSLSDSNEGVEI
ncbi:MAG: hypothetical protein FWD52_02230 [Candidatus Bathyarchaeota archaeon]|nr:hypothetical protein [Candidatus Termiticorpusculum sp.]